MLAVSLGGCSLGGEAGIAASGSGTNRSYPAQGFTAIGLRGSDDIDVRVGTGFSVRAEGPSDQLAKVLISKDGDTLQIGRRSSGGFSWSHGDKVKIYVTLPRLASAVIVGSGTMSVDRVEGTAFSGSIAGSGDLNIATLRVDDADLSIAGSGDARAAGAVSHLTVDIAGSGSLDAAGLRAASAAVSVAGSGDVRAAVTGDAKVNLIGSGDVDLGAEGRCNISKKGSGSVRCGR